MEIMSIDLDEQMLGRIDGLASTLSRSRNWVIHQAIERFVDYEEWAIQEIRNGIKEAENGEIADEKEVAEIFSRWGAVSEK